MCADTFPTVGGDGYATMKQVEDDASGARAEYEEARSKCDKLRRAWEEAYEEWQDAVAALRKIGGRPPVDDQTEQSEALDVARNILRERPQPEPELEPEESGTLQVAAKRGVSRRAPSRPASIPESSELTVTKSGTPSNMASGTPLLTPHRPETASSTISSVRNHCVEDDAAAQIQKEERQDIAAAELALEDDAESTQGFGSQEEVSEETGASASASKRCQQLNAKSTFEPDGSGRVWRNTDQERAILYLTHK
jgi:hypothetical protein